MPVAYPPLEAYRRDVARRGDERPFGPNDGRWVAAAMLLQRYLSAELLDRRPIGAELAKYLAFETELTFCRAALELTVEIEEAGALNLAASWLDLLAQAVPADQTLNVGRVRAARARVSRRLGNTELSRSLYTEVEQLGESAAEPELTARAWIGFGVIAAERGNYPEARRWYEAAALVADDTSCPEQSQQAHQGLMIVFATAGDLERALIEGWRAYRASSKSVESNAEILTNVSQLLHDAGHHEAALRGFAAVVARATHPRVLLGALGGVAMAAALMGRRRIVEAAASRIHSLERSAWSHPVALALIELSDAFFALGDDARAHDLRERGLHLAEASSHFELAHRARENPPARPEQIRAHEFGSAASQIITDIESLDAPSDLCEVG